MTYTRRSTAILAHYPAIEAKGRARRCLQPCIKSREPTNRGYYCDPVYPDKHLRLSLPEVQRGAGLGRLRTSKPAGKKVKRDTIQFYEVALQKASSEAQIWQLRQAELEKEVTELKQEIETIRGSSANVVGIKSGRTE